MLLSSYQNSFDHQTWPQASFLQMGQPADLAWQRQQTDNLQTADSHGPERELQFCDFLECRRHQAVG